jgi:CRISPR-associated protein Cas1
MYAWRLGESLPQGDIAALRGVEGARMKETYLLLARKYGVEWCGRRYDRQNPESADPPNQAINHAATAVEAAATIAIAATGTIPSLGFIHEDSANAFCLDIADLFRDSITIPVAFEATKLWEKQRDLTIDRHVRRLAGQRFRQLELIPKMIDRIKELLSVDDRGCNSGCG